MHKEKEHAQLSDMIERAQKRGINPLAILEFFTTWYEPNDVIKAVDEIEHSYTMSFLSTNDNSFDNQDMKGHLNFLRLLKNFMNDAILVSN